MIMFGFYYTNTCSRISIVLDHWNSCPQVDMSLGHIILIPSQIVFAQIPKMMSVLSCEGTHANCIIFGLIRPRIEPTATHTRDEHAN
jgi:hypothetical protein